MKSPGAPYEERVAWQSDASGREEQEAESAPLCMGEGSQLLRAAEGAGGHACAWPAPERWLTEAVRALSCDCTQVYVLMAWLPTFYEKGLKMDMANHTVLNFLPFLVMFIFSNLSGVAADRLIGKQVRRSGRELRTDASGPGS